jgi:hypothetical protein
MLRLAYNVGSFIVVASCVAMVCIFAMAMG